MLKMQKRYLIRHLVENLVDEEKQLCPIGKGMEFEVHVI